jgi:hypothetical protein
VSILIGLVIATLLIWGWARASVLVAIFLTLCGALGLGIIGLFRTGDTTLEWIAVIMLAVVWAPVSARVSRWQRVSALKH